MSHNLVRTENNLLMLIYQYCASRTTVNTISNETKPLFQIIAFVKLVSQHRLSMEVVL